MSKNAFTLHYVSIESCFGFGGTHTHTHPAAETGQELETTGKGMKSHSLQEPGETFRGYYAT